ncbi:unnamed protein product [Phytophthora lilii]|uniref:Unnamed protein product n=1 Tax=Phytophthora lilii TaxID=2077276 RepID=A0A9W6X5T1_9STRA|nr:unnamed protein product [Phytophthora lilii]
MKCRCVPVQGAENGLFGECVSPADLSFVTVDGGDTFTVGIMAGGEAVAWGRGFYGEVPAEDGTESAVKNAQAPVQLKLPEPCQAVACGSNHGLALTDSGRVAAWGWNRFGQVAATAEEEVVRVPTIVAFSMPVQIIKVAAGGRHSMAVDSSGRVWAWGSNEYGQLGVGSDVMQLHTPVPVALPTDVRIEHSAAGWAHSALISSGGEVLTFGWGLYNQLGHGSTQNEHQPVVVDALRGLDSKVVQVACGNWHSAGKEAFCIVTSLLVAANFSGMRSADGVR